MKRWISACAVAAAFAVTAQAQDSTTTTKTQIKADDAKAITATGCLVPGLAPDVYALRGSIIARGKEVTNQTRTRADVDGDQSRVRTDSKTKAEGGHDRVNGGTVVVYDLSPQAGVNLAPHVGQQVQLTAILLDRGKGDADVKIKENTKVEREHAPDSETKRDSKLTVARGEGPRLNVISVKPLGQPCT